MYFYYNRNKKKITEIIRVDVEKRKISLILVKKNTIPLVLRKMTKICTYNPYNTHGNRQVESIKNS